MRDLFTTYRKPTEEEFAEMWRLCVFAFDANMLLNIYRYTPETGRKEYVRIVIKHLCEGRVELRREISDERQITGTELFPLDQIE